MSLGFVLGGLFAAAVFLYPALQLKKRGKWKITTGILMAIAGLGLVGIAAWLTRLFAGLTSTLIVGGIALVILAGFVVATIADLSDKRLDHPWNLFAMPSLLTVVLLTGGTTFSYLGEQIQQSAATISQQMGAQR